MWNCVLDCRLQPASSTSQRVQKVLGACEDQGINVHAHIVANNLVSARTACHRVNDVVHDGIHVTLKLEVYHTCADRQRSLMIFILEASQLASPIYFTWIVFPVTASSIFLTVTLFHGGEFCLAVGWTSLFSGCKLQSPSL